MTNPGLSGGRAMLELADRCEAHATRLTQGAFIGFDNMRHGKQTLREDLAQAANAFACAAALRARAADTPSVKP